MVFIEVHLKNKMMQKNLQKMYILAKKTLNTMRKKPIVSMAMILTMHTYTLGIGDVENVNLIVAKNILDDDLPSISKNFISHNNKGEKAGSHLGFSIDYKDLNDHIFIPEYYNPEIRKELETLKNSGKYDLVSIGELIDKGVLQVRRGNEIGSQFYGGYRRGNASRRGVFAIAIAQPGGDKPHRGRLGTLGRTVRVADLASQPNASWFRRPA